MRLGGDAVSDAEVRRQIGRGERYDGIVLDDDLDLRIRPTDWPGTRGNHSCDPNLWLAAPLQLAARRAIEQDEEVVSDYATYTMAAEWSMECSCRSSVCRGTLTGDDWATARASAEYAGHFAPPITRRISSRLTAEHNETLGQ
jgi:hypothetical protein